MSKEENTHEKACLDETKCGHNITALKSFIEDYKYMKEHGANFGDLDDKSKDALIDKALDLLVKIEKNVSKLMGVHSELWE